MKQEITAQVHMLPQDKQDWNKGDLVIDIYGLCIAEHESNSKSPKCKAQHIYFTSDEPIQGGDWYWNRVTNTVHKAVAVKVAKHPDFLKIIASTDPALGLPAIPTTWIRDEYVPSNGSIKEVKLELEFNHALKSMATESRIKLTSNNEVLIVDEPTDQPIDPTYRHYRFDEDVALEEGMKIMDAKWSVKQQHVVDQELEDAADNWVDSHYNKGVEYSKAKRGAANPKSGFIAGANWQKEQSAKHAIEFANWILGEASHEWNKRASLPLEEAHKQLYELWQQTRNK